MQLELANSEVFDAPSAEQVAQAVDLLRPHSNEELVLHKSATSALRIANPQPRRYYLFNIGYKASRAVQPVSQAIAKRTAVAFAEGKRKWQGNIRFEAMEEDSGFDSERPIEETSSESLQLSLRRLELIGILPALGFFLAIVAFLVWSFASGWYFDSGEKLQVWFALIVSLLSLVALFRVRSRMRAELASRSAT